MTDEQQQQTYNLLPERRNDKLRIIPAPVAWEYLFQQAAMNPEDQEGAGWLLKEPAPIVRQQVERINAYRLANPEKYDGPIQVAADIGCGGGRNMEGLYLAGVPHIIGVDASRTAVMLATRRMMNIGATNNFFAQVGDMTDLKPFIPSNSVDLGIAVSVLNHGTREEFNQALSEARRILKPNGHLLLTLISTQNPAFKTAIPIDPDDPYTRVTQEGKDAHVIHHFCTPDSVSDTLRFIHKFSLNDIGYISTIDPEDIAGVSRGHIGALVQKVSL